MKEKGRFRVIFWSSIANAFLIMSFWTVWAILGDYKHLSGPSVIQVTSGIAFSIPQISRFLDLFLGPIFSIAMFSVFSKRVWNEENGIQLEGFAAFIGIACGAISSILNANSPLESGLFGIAITSFIVGAIASALPVNRKGKNEVAFYFSAGCAMGYGIISGLVIGLIPGIIHSLASFKTALIICLSIIFIKHAIEKFIATRQTEA